VTWDHGFEMWPIGDEMAASERFWFGWTAFSLEYGTWIPHQSDFSISWPKPHFESFHRTNIHLKVTVTSKIKWNGLFIPTIIQDISYPQHGCYTQAIFAKQKKLVLTTMSDLLGNFSYSTETFLLAIKHQKSFTISVEFLTFSS